MSDKATEQATLNGVIVLGSARSDGNTRKIAEVLARKTGLDLVDLNDWEIGHFTYERDRPEDDFIPLMRKLLQYDLLVMTTPVYWYSMSSVMKTFFDRFTDLLKWHKDLGRQLRGKSLALMSCSESNDRDDFFVLPFEKIADYLGMEYAGDIHAWLEKGEVAVLADEEITRFSTHLRHWAVARATS